MKKFSLLCVFLLALTTYAQAQTSYTVNRGLALPPAAPGTWGEQYNNNFQTLDTSSIPRVTNATKPTSPTVNTVIVVTDAASGNTCSTGGGSFQNTCQWNGSTWTVIGGSVGGTGSVFDSSVAFTADVSPSQITANQNDYAGCASATNAVCRITTDASRNITGFTGGSDGTLLFLYNVGSFNAVLKNLTTSAAANQLTINADITIAPNQGIILQYDATSTKWRAASGISGGGAGQAADNDLTALAGFSSTGFPARTATDTWAQRSMATANASNIGITNPAGIAGDPTWDVGANVALTTRSFTYTATAGDFDLGAGGSFTFPKATGAAPSAEGRCAQDTTAHRLKCNFGSGVVTLAITSEMQALNANLTALAGLTGVNNSLPVFTGAGTMTTTPLVACIDSAGQHLNYDTATRSWICGTTTTGGLSGGTTNKFLIATSATTYDATTSNLTQATGVINASGGFTVGDVATNYLSIDPAAVTGVKTWTALNFSGTIRPSTGAITAGHVLTTDANGLIIDGGVAGAGTWTDSSVQTTTSNKTLIDALAGGGAGNVIKSQLVASFEGGSLTADGSNCQDPTKATINSGPTQYVILCATPNSAIIDGVIIGLKQAVGTIKVRLKANDTVSTKTLDGTFKAQCRASGAAPSSTWGSTQTVSITLTTANNTYEGLTAAITPNGTCAINSDLYIRYNATGGSNSATTRILGLTIEQQT